MKISVCMATYNGEKYLRPQLDSILKQLSKSDELIVSDDGSTDGTVQLVQSYNDPRIKLLHSRHRNLIFNFENALKAASGELVFLSDQDDIWHDGKVEKYRRQLQKNSLVFSNALMFKDNDIKAAELFFKDKKKKTGLINNLVKVKFLGATLAFKKEVLNRALPFPKNIPMHDIWIGLVAETMGSTCYIDEPLIYYRRHGYVASTTGSRSKNSLFKKIQIRAVLGMNLIKRQWFKK